MKPFVIGIAGPSGSGKTELALGLVRAPAGRSALRVGLDHYYKDLAGLSPDLRVERNFDHPDALDRELLVDQLGALIGGSAVEQPVYRFDSHTRAPRGKRVTSADVIVVDGLYCLFWPEVRELIDAKLFIDADHATCLARRLTRDVRARGRTEASVRRQYELTVRPMYERFVRPTREHADLVLPGAASIAATLSAARAHLGWDPRPAGGQE